MLTYATEILAPNYNNIEIVVIEPRGAVKLVQERLKQGLDVVAARAVTATSIKQAKLEVAVVTIPVTSFDIIRAINAAKAQGKRIAVVAHATMVLGIDFLAEVLGVEIQHYAATYGQDYEELIKEAISDGAEVILGGALAVAAAKRHGIPFSFLNQGKEGLLQAAQEATQIQEALEIDKAKKRILSAIADNTSDGIITVDQKHIVTAFNPIAQKLTKIDKANAIGHSIEKVLPQFNFNKAFQWQTTPHTLINVNSNSAMCSSVPIMINDKSFGAVITIQEISRIQKIEAMIRKEIYSRGLIAKFHFEDIIGESSVMKETIAMAKDFAVTSSSVLILGETGTGKEVFAQSIHNASSRSKGPFVAINCASLPAQLLESELFGYVGGAFTGANKEGKPGLFEVAHGGTIFLDELGEMDYVNQGRLLRALQEKAVVRLGSFKVVPVDVRVIAATNKDLDALVHEHKFRDDLYYRLNVLRLDLPSLKDRKTDIFLYANAFLDQFSAESGKNFKLTPDALSFLEDYPWPGNIRECRNLMERIVAIAKTDVINSAFLAKLIKHKLQQIPAHSPKEERLILEITKALHDANGNYTAAAELLGINRTTLYRRMQKLKIEY